MTACGTIVHANDYTLQYMSQQSQINSYITVQAAVENPTASHLWLGRAVLAPRLAIALWHAALQKSLCLSLFLHL